MLQAQSRKHTQVNGLAVMLLSENLYAIWNCDSTSNISTSFLKRASISLKFSQSRLIGVQDARLCLLLSSALFYLKEEMR
jgi:hypothetical protein